MNQRWTLLITACCWIAGTASLHAAEASVAVDRSRITLGESFHVKVQVRKSAGKPLVQPPRVPGCRIELLGTNETQSAAPVRVPSPSAKRQPGSAAAPLIEAIGKLEADAQKALQDHAASQGLSGPPINQEAFDLLRATRQQALDALRGPSNTEYQTTFRITPERAGILTLPSFIVETGGKTYLTKPIEVAVDESPANAAAPPTTPTAPKEISTPSPAPAPTKPVNLPPPYAASELLGQQTHPGSLWPIWTAIVLAPFALLICLCGYRIWRTWRRATAPQRRQRQVMTTARRQLGMCLTNGATPEAIAEALTAFIRSRYALPPGEVTPAEAATSLEAAGVSAKLAARFAGVLEACSTARFVPGGVAVLEKDLAAQVAQAQDVVGDLERLGR